MSQTPEKPEKAARFLRRIVALADSLVDLAVLIALLLLLAFGCYALWDSRQVHSAASSAQYEIYKPTEKNTKSFDELRKMNPEVIGWITLYGTAVDYPVVQGEDNMKYVNTSAEGEYSLSGAIFLDASSSPDFSDYNSIIHGHNMAENAMFGQLSEFADREFFSSHIFGNLFYDGKDHGLVIYEYLQADAYDAAVFSTTKKTGSARQEYYDLLRDMAVNFRTFGYDGDNRIVLLSTCALNFTNARDIIVAYITDETYEDTFGKDQGRGFRPDRNRSWDEFEKIPLWIWSVLFLDFLLIVYGIYRMLGIITKDRRKEEERQTLYNYEFYEEDPDNRRR